MSGKYLCAIYLALVATAFAQAPRRIRSAVNLRQTVRLPGNTVWRAHAAVDEGAAPPDLELQHMLLLLRRSPTQEAALRQMLAAQRAAGSPEYHHWLTPQQFGVRFGPAAGDLAAVEQWLQAQGFTVNGISPGELAIDFSGNAGQMQQALHTTIHRYRVQRPGGEVQQYWANATDPAVPAALAPVVAGVVSLNNFVSRPAIQVLGQGNGHVATVLDPSPELNFTLNGTNLHALVPGDFNTIYNVSPLLAQGVNGSQETIAVVARSDINTSDVTEFRKLFQPGATGTFQVVPATANTPGIATNGDQDEATLDAEWAGAAAPSATVDLVVADSSATTDGVTLSALYIVDHDLAPILTASYGLCEAQMTAAGNEFFNSLWEQAAAEGITVLVSAGDDGAAGCDDPSAPEASNGLAVSGFASTPFDMAVGGTQFNEANSPTSYWGANRTGDYSSALGYIPEQPWDEIGDGQGGAGISAGSGGASSVYARPYWQVAPDVAAISGGMRLLPDVSFNASAGHDPYVICLALSCEVAADGSFRFYAVGGTSASAPSFAGVMALVDQKSGSAQGLANPVLYRLASTSGVFHDTTSGSNDVPCEAGSPDCPTSGELGFQAVAGYDEASGLGSIDVANLVNSWGTIKFGASKTALSITPPTNATVGQSIPLNISVTGGSSGPAPTGTVDLLAQFSDGSEQAVGSFALGSGGTLAASTAGLPGGTYSVVASYEGDANYGPSTSAPVSVTVAKITPTVSVQFLAVTAAGGLGQAITSVIYGNPVDMHIVVSGPSGSVAATGSVMGTSGFAVGPYALDPAGAADVEIDSVAAGTYQITASYPGDNSYNAATATPVALTVDPSPTTIAISAASTDQIGVVVNTQSRSAQGALAVMMYDGTEFIGDNYISSPSTDPTTGYLRYSDTFWMPLLPRTTATITAQVSDPNFAASTSNALTVPTPGNPVFSPGWLKFGPTAYGQTSPPQAATLTNTGGESVALGPFAAQPPFALVSSCGTSLASGQSCTITVTFAPTLAGANGPNAMGTIGVDNPEDPGGALATLVFTGTVQTFDLMSSIPAPITPGQSATYQITLTPYGGFQGNVALGCTGLPPFTSCRFTPAAATLDGKNNGSATLTVTTKAPPASGSLDRGGWPLDWRWLLALAALIAAVVPVAVLEKRQPAAIAAGGGLALTLLILAACGGSPSVPPPPPPPPASQKQAQAAVAPSTLSFGGVAVGGTSAAQTVTVNSVGSAPLQINRISVSSGQAADFQQTNTCGSSVAASASCQISVKFAPSAGGSESSTLVIDDNSVTGSAEVTLSGSGLTSTPPGYYLFTVTGTSPGQPTIKTQASLTVTAPGASGGVRGVRARAWPRRR